MMRAGRSSRGPLGAFVIGIETSHRHVDENLNVDQLVPEHSHAIAAPPHRGRFFAAWRRPLVAHEMLESFRVLDPALI